jgi:hypothetical protein
MPARHVPPAGRVVALALLMALATSPATAGLPELTAGAGLTAAVDGDPAGGGPSLALSLMWPVEDHLRFGVMGFADDLGDRQGRLLASDGSDLGPISTLHRDAIGLAWRVEAHVSSTGNLDPFFVATWGGYRITDDRNGTTLRAVNAAGFGLGVGLARRVGGAQALGLLARYQQLSRGAAPRYLSVALEWRRHRNAAH